MPKLGLKKPRVKKDLSMFDKEYGNVTCRQFGKTARDKKQAGIRE